MVDIADQSELQSLLDQSEQAYLTFRPRPDQPERFDEQKGFYDSKLSGVAWLVGGNGAGTTEAALAKVAKFILRDQPPPRRDTPFWIISGTYEQVMEACWKEKLYGHGHVPGSEVEWDRIAWYRPNDGWPYRVPLKPWPGRPGKNWMLEFKSYEQGRSKLQARSIGGFLFSEQFPWSLLEEVLRGCREYNFPGSKLCEFTPVDPSLSVRLEEMHSDPEQWPENWGMFRANTECALEAGHIQPKWFDEFFGMVPEEMLLTRMTGAWASFEGAIYQGFIPSIHLVGDDVINFPDNVRYRRAIDWGFGPDNAFACLWGYKNGVGQWFIYDEYWSTDQTKTVLDHLQCIREKRKWPDHPDYGTTWCDPSDPGSMRMAQRCGFSISAASNSVHEGIDHVRYLLKKIPGKNEPRLFIHKENCKNLAREMRTYKWDVGGKKNGLGERIMKREPLKVDDHLCDALRYLTWSEAQYAGVTPTTLKRDIDHSRHGVHLHRNGARHGVWLPSRGGMG